MSFRFFLPEFLLYIKWAPSSSESPYRMYQLAFGPCLDATGIVQITIET